MALIVISGGQTGVDAAALRAARRLGLQTGGWAPRGWRTLDGPAPWLADYGLREHASDKYPPRTEANVRMADVTVRVARSFSTSGERCTLAAILKWRKLYLDIPVAGGAIAPDCAGKLRDFLRGRGVVNFAGNSEETSPGIGAVVEEFLFGALGGAL